MAATKKSAKAKLAKLAQMTTDNGATKAEAETARKLAAKIATPAKAETKEVYLGDVRITRYCPGSANAHFFGSRLKHFLAHAKEHPFSYRTIPNTNDFGQGDYYNILNWLISNGFVTKLINAQYRIKSVKEVKERFNSLLTDLLLK